MFLPHVLNVIAAHREEDPQLLAERITGNTERFFGLSHRP
jgi:Tat protein secretion system quality control protein TatD with DNase activity